MTARYENLNLVFLELGSFILQLVKGFKNMKWIVRSPLQHISVALTHPAVAESPERGGEEGAGGEVGGGEEASEHCAPGPAPPPQPAAGAHQERPAG